MIWFILGVVLTFCLFRYFDGCWLWEREDQIYGDDYGAQVPDSDVTVFASGGGYAHHAPGSSVEIVVEGSGVAGGGGGGASKDSAFAQTGERGAEHTIQAGGNGGHGR